jgi:peptide/nickel transport system permease protein
MMIVLFALKLHWLPSGGDDGTILSLVLPAMTIGMDLTAGMGRTTRSSMLDVIRQDYLRTVRAKGASERRVIWGHALKNALIPILTVAGSQFAGLLGGSALTETVFAWPGTGRMLIDAINSRDTQVVTGTLILKAIIISFVILAVDLLYAVVDPRIRGRYTKKRRKKNT